MASDFEDRFLKAMGKVVVEFERLEGMLDSGLWVLLNTGQRPGHIVVTSMSFRNKLDAFDALARHRKEGSLDKELHENLVRHLSGLEERRNRVLHSVRGEVTLDDTRIRINGSAKGSRGFSVAPEEYTDADLSKMEGEISSAADELRDYVLSFEELVKGTNTVRSGE